MAHHRRQINRRAMARAYHRARARSARSTPRHVSQPSSLAVLAVQAIGAQYNHHHERVAARLEMRVMERNRRFFTVHASANQCN